MTSLVSTLSLFEFCVALISVLAVGIGALFYFRRVRLERPAVGRFNGRDVLFLYGFLVVLPVVYLAIPKWAVTSLLALTFVVALSIGFRQLINPTVLWIGIGALVGANIWIGHHMLGTLFGWTLYWAGISVLVVLAAISVANLYVQGGMQLRHVSYFALGLAVYDGIFTLIWPVTNYLVREFVGFPLYPATGMRIFYNEAVIGLGDLLVYGAFIIAAYKAYGRRALRLAWTLVLVFGTLVPPLSGLLINYIDSRADIIIPAQMWFGPAAFLGFLWLRKKYGRERTMAEFMASGDVVVARATPAPATTPASAQGPEETGRPERDVAAVPH
jgi:hypothetical protein